MPLLRRWLPLAVYILVPSALILPLLFSGKTLYGADMYSVFHYSRIAIADAFRSGRLPVWDPHVMAGFPMLAEPQNAIFYPPTWFCVFLSAETFWILSAWSHLILAGAFAHRWLERGLGLNDWSALAGACVFMISGYICGHVVAGHVNYVWAYPWIPAVLWRLERFLAGPTLRRGLFLSLVLSMLFLAGVPQYVYFIGLLVFFRLVHFILATLEGRKARAIQAGRTIAWLTLGLAFCAPQLFPTLELVGQMQRGQGSNTSYFVDFSLDPRQLGELLFPPSRHPSQWWETCGFVGGAALLLTLAMHAGKHSQRHLWSSIAGLSLILALGNASPFYDGFVAVVPGAGWFRGPGRYLLLFTVAMAGMAGMGFEVLWNRGSVGFRVLGGALALASFVQLIVFAHPSFVEQKQFDLQFSGGLQAEFRDRCGLEGRVANGAIADIGRCQAAGIDHVGGYEPMMLRRYAETLNAARGAATDIDMVILASVAPHPVVQMLSVRVWLGRGWNINREPNVLRIEPESVPRSWLVNNAVVLEDKDERLRTIGFKKWDPRKTVLLETYPAEAPPTTTEQSAGRAKVLARKPGYYEIEAENDANAYLVLSEAYYPGWTAEVDGKPVDVLPANHLLQTVRLPAGKHVVRFEYRSRFLGLGFVVAALAALIPVGLLVRRHRHQLALERLPGAP